MSATMTRREAERILSAQQAYDVMKDNDALDTFRTLHEAMAYAEGLRGKGIDGLHVRTILIDEQGNEASTPCQRFQAIRMLAQTKKP